MRSPHWKSVIIYRYTISPRMSYVIKCCGLICRYGVGYKPFSLNTRAVKHLIDSDGQVTSMPVLIASSSPPASPMNQRPEKKQLNLRIRSTWHFKHRYRENFKGIFIVDLKSDIICWYLFTSYYIIPSLLLICGLLLLGICIQILMPKDPNFCQNWFIGGLDNDRRAITYVFRWSVKS